MTRRFVSTEELADRTGLSSAWIKREAAAGRLPSLRIGRRRMFEYAVVCEAIAAHYADPAIRHSVPVATAKETASENTDA